MNLSKKSKIILLAVVLAILCGYIGLRYAYKAHKTIDEIAVTFSGTSEVFLEKVKTDTAIWQDVVVELSGTITSIDQRGITLNGSIYCQLETDTSIATLQEGQNITIKGRMIGYDDLLEEIKLDQTILK